MTAAIHVENLSKHFGRIRALDGVTFDVPTESICGLLGPNGAGKTTLFSVTANFLQPTGGRIEVLGVDVQRISELRGRMTILPQDAAFQRNVPILEQLVFFRLLDGRTRREAEQEVRDALDLVGLADKAKRGVSSLSHGMIKRLGIAQAFLGRPEVTLLDEPTSGLDPKSAREVRDIIRALRASRATVVVSSHNLDEIQDLCDHVVILDEGKLVSEGSVDDLTRAGREVDLKLSRALEPPEVEALRALPCVADVMHRETERYTVTLDVSGEGADMDQVLSEIQRTILEMGITPRGIAEGRSLETHFLKLTGDDGE